MVANGQQTATSLLFLWMKGLETRAAEVVELVMLSMYQTNPQCARSNIMHCAWQALCCVLRKAHNQCMEGLQVWADSSWESIT